jgi:preprotein translocase subunit YajC
MTAITLMSIMTKIQTIPQPRMTIVRLTWKRMILGNLVITQDFTSTIHGGRLFIWEQRGTMIRSTIHGTTIVMTSGIHARIIRTTRHTTLGTGILITIITTILQAIIPIISRTRCTNAQPAENQVLDGRER